MPKTPQIPVAPPSNTLLTAYHKKLLKDFYNFKSGDWRDYLRKTAARSIVKRGEQHAMDIFQAAAIRIPAYKDFLLKNKIKAASIKTIADFQHIPTTDKQSYISQYPLDALVWDGNLDRYGVIAVSSGSTGRPFTWPRDVLVEKESDYLHELFMMEVLRLQGRTLAIVGFAMGMYTAGLITATSLQALSAKGRPVITVTPGLHIEDIISSIIELSPHVENIVLFAYPSWISKIGESIAAYHSELSKKNFYLVPAGEPFDEQWRAQTIQLFSYSKQPPKIFSLYGCSEKLILGHETHESIALRQTMMQHKPDVIRSRATPMAPGVYQYHPHLRFIESVEENIVFTATGGIPLIRYNIFDRGGVISYTEFNKNKINRELGDQVGWHLPFVYVRGREDMVILHGANIYVNTFEKVLRDGELKNITSGNFVLEVKHDQNVKKSVLYAHVEIKDSHSLSAPLQRKIEDIVTSFLRSTNAEYQVIRQAHGPDIGPRVKLYSENSHAGIFVKASGKPRRVFP